VHALVTDLVTNIRYRSGLAIPRTGIYTVRHKQHRLPHQVTLLKDQVFPPCAQCNQAVEFELLMGIDDLAMSLSPFRVTLHQIPELEVEAQNEDGGTSDASKEKAG
jgi:hypothetical protein